MTWVNYQNLKAFQATADKTISAFQEEQKMERESCQTARDTQRDQFDRHHKELREDITERFKEHQQRSKERYEGLLVALGQTPLPKRG
jgi:hypothetical protein